MEPILTNHLLMRHLHLQATKSQAMIHIATVHQVMTHPATVHQAMILPLQPTKQKTLTSKLPNMPFLLTNPPLSRMTEPLPMFLQHPIILKSLTNFLPAALTTTKCQNLQPPMLHRGTRDPPTHPQPLPQPPKPPHIHHLPTTRIPMAILPMNQ